MQAEEMADCCTTKLGPSQYPFMCIRIHSKLCETLIHISNPESPIFVRFSSGLVLDDACFFRIITHKPGKPNAIALYRTTFDAYRRRLRTMASNPALGPSHIA